MWNKVSGSESQPNASDYLDVAEPRQVLLLGHSHFSRIRKGLWCLDFCVPGRPGGNLVLFAEASLDISSAMYPGIYTRHLWVSAWEPITTDSTVVSLPDGQAVYECLKTCISSCLAFCLAAEGVYCICSSGYTRWYFSPTHWCIFEKSK